VLSISITSNKDRAFFQQVNLAEKTTIGRDPTSIIHLPDPDKHISRLHALIEVRDGDYHLLIASKTNAVFINDKSYPHGNDVILTEGDRIGIYNYVLTVNALTKPASTPSGTPASSLDTFISTSSPWMDATTPYGNKGEADPFGLSDLISKPLVNPTFGPDPFAIQSKGPQGLVADIAPIAHENENAILDPLALLNKRDSLKPLNTLSNTPSASPFDDILQSLKPSSSSNILGSSLYSNPIVDFGGHHPAGTRSLEHVHDINLPFSPPPVPDTHPKPLTQAPKVQNRFIDDPFADTLRTYISKLPGAAAQSAAPTPQLPHALTPPERTEPEPLWPSQTGVYQAGSAHMPPVAANNEQMELLLNAFCNSAGLSKQAMTAEEAQAFMTSIGTILRASVEGIVSLLASRSMLKGELGAEDRTMVATRDNNPLKFMPDINEVMQFLFENKKLNSSRYLSPVQSIQGACEDLIFHEIGTSAGMRAAVEGSIRRFNPQLIETEFDKSGKKMVLNRRAALWDTYVENYRKIEESMVDDVGQIFERDFRRAYDMQIRKLKIK
jgi:type VI secretion system FHA domain protein